MTVICNELDKRIKDFSDIQSYRQYDDKYIGEYGYFSDSIVGFSDLDSCTRSVLTYIDEMGGTDMIFDDDENYYRFFLPESLVLKESKEKKWRAYTIAEFQETFTVGRAVRFRRKDTPNKEHLLIFGGYYTLRDGRVSILFGIHLYTLEELFEQYEWQEFYTDEYRPFGIKE